MKDYFEIDFLNVGESSSGDAICVRYSIDDEVFVHVIDGGYKNTGKIIVDHINEYYGVNKIDNVIVTHDHQDHTGGIETVLRSFDVENLWMNLPWYFADVLLDHFPSYKSKDSLIRKLKSEYENLAEIEEVADELGIPINCAFQGTVIGKFTVMAPTVEKFCELVLLSEKTPKSTLESSLSMISKAAYGMVNLIKSLWGEENFPNENTSEENEMSIVQYSNLCKEHILLTGDTGRDGLNSAFEYASSEEFGGMPKISFFQIPHHGSRRNVSTEVLDKWFGPVLSKQNQNQNSKFYAYVSAALEDNDHPRKAVIRAMIHRGGEVFSNEECSIKISKNAPNRDRWHSLTALPYPEEQEE